MQSVQSIVPRIVSELLREGPLSQGKLEVAWRTAVGDAVARASTVHLQPDGIVEIRAADARWANELRRQAPLILGRMRELVGNDRIKWLSIK